MEYLRHKLNNRVTQILDQKKYFQSAVLLPLIMEEGRLSILFEVRAQHLKGQPGEICFPGGRLEKKDKTPQETAVRETAEELGLSPASLEIFGALDTMVTPHQLLIYSYVGLIKEGTSLSPSPDEVERIFTVPLAELQALQPLCHQVNVKLIPEDNFPYHLIPQGSNYPWRESSYPVYFYQYNDIIIWGLTARILHNFLHLIS